MYNPKNQIKNLKDQINQPIQKSDDHSKKSNALSKNSIPNQKQNASIKNLYE